MFYTIGVIHGINQDETGHSGQVCTQKWWLSFSSLPETNRWNLEALGIAAECNGKTRADYLEQIVRDNLLPSITREEESEFPNPTWKEESLLPCNTPKEEHHPQSPAVPMPQLEALYALRERILFDLKLGKQAAGYKVALKALNRFIAELTTSA